MKIYNLLNEIPATKKGILTIGTFDGLHIGHREIVNLLSHYSEKERGETFVITFVNHPLSILYPKRVPKSLGSIDFKIDFFKKNKIDHLILLEFTQEIANISHQDFFNFIFSKFDSLTMVVGNNFRFGKGNFGNIEYLRGFEGDKYCLNVVNKVYYKNHNVSSSTIRQFIRHGEIELANEMLDREYFIDGKIISGDQLGRSIEFPTINILNENYVHPKAGVYKSRIEIDENIFLGMTFIGKKSVGNDQMSDQLIESHIFNFSEDVYNRNAKIYFQERIRDEMQFNSLEELKIQLIKDKNQIISMENNNKLHPNITK